MIVVTVLHSTEIQGQQRDPIRQEVTCLIEYTEIVGLPPHVYAGGDHRTLYGAKYFTKWEIKWDREK